MPSALSSRPAGGRHTDHAGMVPGACCIGRIVHDRTETDSGHRGGRFLGSHLCERLLAQGHDVICLDNSSPARNQRQPPAGPAQFRADPARYHAADLARGRRDLQPGLSRRPGPLPVQPHQDHEDLGPGRDPRAGHGQTLPGKGAPGLDQRSLRRSPGPSPAGCYRGSVNTIGPRACYDEGKRAAETLFMDYYRSNRINIRIVRIFNTYGPRMHPFDGRVISNFIRQALDGEDITIFGDGSQTRSFCYRDDMVEGFIRMMDGPGRACRTGKSGQPGGIYDPPVGRDRAGADRLAIELVYPAPAGRRSRLSGGPTFRWPRSTWAGGPRSRSARDWRKTIDWFRSIDMPITGRRRPIIRGDGNKTGSKAVPKADESRKPEKTKARKRLDSGRWLPGRGSSAGRTVTDIFQFSSLALRFSFFEFFAIVPFPRFPILRTFPNP